jgi:hypothetical protein
MPPCGVIDNPFNKLRDAEVAPESALCFKAVVARLIEN